jgi:hypothetical protein
VYNNGAVVYDVDGTTVITYASMPIGTSIALIDTTNVVANNKTGIYHKTQSNQEQIFHLERKAPWLAGTLMSLFSGAAFTVKKGFHADTMWIQTEDSTTLQIDDTPGLKFIQASNQNILGSNNISVNNRIISLTPTISLTKVTATALVNTDYALDVILGIANFKDVICTQITQTSDERKKDILSDVRYLDARDVISRIQPVYFAYKADEKKRKHCGVSAQQVREVVPDAVHEDNDGFLSVNYQYFTGLLLAHCKQTDQEIESLRAELSEMKRLYLQ